MFASKTEVVDSSIRQRNQQIPSIVQHQESLPTANHLTAVGQLKVENNENKSNHTKATGTITTQALLKDARKLQLGIPNFTMMQRVAL